MAGMRLLVLLSAAACCLQNVHGYPPKAFLNVTEPLTLNISLFHFQSGPSLSGVPTCDLLGVPAGATYQKPVYDSSYNVLYYEEATDGNEDTYGTAPGPALLSPLIVSVENGASVELYLTGTTQQSNGPETDPPVPGLVTVNSTQGNTTSGPFTLQQTPTVISNSGPPFTVQAFDSAAFVPTAEGQGGWVQGLVGGYQCGFNISFVSAPSGTLEADA